MGKVIYFNAQQQAGSLAAARALRDVDHLLDLCREIELRGRWLTREQGIELGQHLVPELFPRLESIVRSLRKL